MIHKVRVFRKEEKVEDYVAEERGLRLVVNDKIVADLKLSPSYEEECVIGYCAGEGFIKGLDDILEIRIERNIASVKADVDIFDTAYETYLSTDCISGWRTRVKTERVWVTSDLSVEAEAIFRNMRKLVKNAKIWKKTGGVHAAAFVNWKNFLLAEDVSRHIAVDKVIGLAMKKGIELSRSYILCTGRLPGDMVIKAARVNIPILASRTAPLYSGIECAKKTNLTLAGFVRGEKMNIYTHPRRIRFKD